VLSGIRRVAKEWREQSRFKALPPEARSIVFYAEDAASWVHLGPIVEELVGGLDRRVCYLTSVADDPVFERDLPKLECFYIGEGMLRATLFAAIQADVLVMTMPDLETMQIKRSRAKVHYAYVFHSLVSSHMIYRPHAFDHFDSLLCCGPHHVEEARASEAAKGLAPRKLIEHGYGRLDTILAERERRGARPPAHEGALRILVAPSWGAQGLIEAHGVETTRALLDGGFHVTLRPHPFTARKWPESIEALEREFSGHERFALETNMSSQDSLHASDLMISDWSGAALEYAFGQERPVLFLDVPRKVNNPDYERIPCEPLEASVRCEIGVVHSPDALDQLPAAVERLCADPGEYRERIRRVREQTVFNVGRSGKAGADAIAALADELRGVGAGT
jgi:YidC/Oxa1 family membrane protein insertase